MVAYNLAGIAKVDASDCDEGFSDKSLMDGSKDTLWKVSKNHGDGLSAWIHIALPRPMIMNGIEFEKSTCKVINDFKVFAKVINGEEKEF